MMRLLIAFPLLLAGVSRAQEDSGNVTGVIRFEGTHKPRRLNAQIDADKHKHGGPHQDGKDVLSEEILLGSQGELANVLVRVKGTVKGEFPAPKDVPVLNADDWQFRPRVIVLRPGQTLTLKNTAFDRFNFHSMGADNGSFDYGILRGEQREVSFKKPEIGIRIQHLCCPWQIAWIHVLDHPFFALTGADGKFEIKGLPPGEYEIEAWHERFGTKTARVKVGAKETRAQNFTFEKK